VIWIMLEGIIALLIGAVLGMLAGLLITGTI